MNGRKGTHMRLTNEGIQKTADWEKCGVRMPSYDRAAMTKLTMEEPIWIHFGAGNIFRGFVAGLQQRLLEQGLASKGIIAAETYDFEIIDRIYKPYDSLTLMVSLKPDGSTDREVIASLAAGLKASPDCPEDWQKIRDVFAAPSLQMCSFTVTEKGYALKNMQGEITPLVAGDMKNGPERPRHAMAVVAALLLHRFEYCAAPLAMVSMDNCSHNGEKLRAAVLEIAQAWVDGGFAPADFMAWLSDEAQVSFPWSMIDKITPRPADSVLEMLQKDGFEAMRPIQTEKHTYIAPFVNAEVPQYLVIEDRFPNGRPALEKAGVYMTDRETVNKVERMKVTTCLNPLHTGLAVCGCLLGYTSIAAEMRDDDLKKLAETIGYAEGLPVVTDPGILKPIDFLREVVEKRLPNPAMPDTPQRIACDTSQKLSIRFGETIKSRMQSETLGTEELKAIPLVLAAWIRYLKGVDDAGNEMAVSPDPMAPALQEALRDVRVGKPETVGEKLRPILSNAVIFGVDLYEAGLGDKVEDMVRDMLLPGGVRKALQRL